MVNVLIEKSLSIVLTRYLKPFIAKVEDIAKKSFFFLLSGTWRLICDLVRPQPWKSRPWGIVLIALGLSYLAVYFYQQVLHSYQVSVLTWVYVNTGLVRWWPPDKFDILKLPFKTVWLGDVVIVLASFGLMNRIWQHMKRHIESEKGLKYFSEWTVKAIDHHTQSVCIATSTPLIHIFHDKPKESALSAYGGEITFENDFCYPFKDALSRCRDNSPSVRFLYVAPEVLRETSPWLPIGADDDYTTYVTGISAFQSDVISNYAKGIETNEKKQAQIASTFRKTSMILPLWIAVVSSKEHCGRGAHHAVVLGLTNRRDLVRALDKSVDNFAKKEIAAKIAEDVMCLRSTDPDIVKFFSGVFESLWDEGSRNFDFILSLLDRARKGHEIEVLLREPYDGSVHARWVAGNPDHIIYATKPR